MVFRLKLMLNPIMLLFHRLSFRIMSEEEERDSNSRGYQGRENISVHASTPLILVGLSPKETNKGSRYNINRLEEVWTAKAGDY